MNDATEEPASNDVAATDANQSSAVENGAIYALQNAGTGNWAGTATTAATADTHNLYQQSSWVSTSQNFRFVSTGDENNTYYIYPLEYGNQNTDQYRALYCNTSVLESSSPAGLNVYPAPFYESDTDSYKWLVEKSDSGYYTIRLYADQRYILTAISSAVGSVTTTGIYEAGNICVKRVTTATTTPTVNQRWNLEYVIPNGTYYMHNCASDYYVGGNSSLTISPMASALGTSDVQTWTIQHITNGKYYLTSSYYLTLCIKSSVPSEGTPVYTEGNMAQPRFQWYIERMEDKSFQIRSVGAETYGYDYVLKAKSASLPDYVQIGSPSDSSLLDNWCIHDGSGRYAHFFLGASSGDPLMPGLLSQVESSFCSQMSYPGFGYTSTTKNNYLNMLDNVEVFSHITHGTEDYINVYNGSYLDYSTYIDDWFDEGDLTNVKVALLASCHSSAPFKTNVSLAKSIYDKGAQTVIAFGDSINIPVTNEWVTEFLSIIPCGYSVHDAMEAADQALYRDKERTSEEQAFINARRVYGSSSIIPCP